MKVLAAPIAAAALVLCCFRFAPIPGVEWYLGPLVYLFVLKRWGLRAGLAAAVICMAPSILWWGHPLSIFIAAGHVAFVNWWGRSRLLVPATLVYAPVAFFGVGAPMLHFYYGAATPVILLVLIRKIINDMTCAALVDLLFLQWRFFEGNRLVSVRRPISLATFVRAWAHAGLLATVVTTFISSTAHFQSDFDYYSLRQLESVREELRNQPAGRSDRLFFIDIPGDSGPVRVAIAERPSLLDGDVVDYLGCRTLDNGRRSQTFNELTDRCSVHPLGIQAGRAAYAMTPDRGPAQQAYRASFWQALPEQVVSVLMTIALALAQFALKRDTVSWRGLLQGFGRSRIDHQPESRFIEFADPLREYIAANNAYVAAQSGASERREALRTLKRSLDLSVLRDIRYDADEGVFRFLEFTADGVPEPQQLRVHPADRANVERAMRSELTVEFRLAGEAGQWRMIYGRGRDEDGGYERGLTFQLHQPRMAIDFMRQRARLQDIGMTAAATAHELQQPLMVASLAAEQGIAQSGAPEQPVLISDRSLFERILGQTRRAQRIVDRISRRARIGDEARPVDPAEVIADVLADVKPQLSRAQATAEVVNRCPPDLQLLVAPTALEQVLINAIRNAADSISAGDRREPGQITITLGVGDGGDFQLTIEDNGAGLAPGGADAAFEPFYTTKTPGAGTGLGLYVSREIVEDWGGRLWLSPRQPSGALFALSLPAERILT